MLITDQGNGRVIEVRRSDNAIVWEYDGLNGPNSAELLVNGNILISDQSNNQALEVTHTTPKWTLEVCRPSSATRKEVTTGSVCSYSAKEYPDLQRLATYIARSASLINESALAPCCGYIAIPMLA